MKRQVGGQAAPASSTFTPKLQSMIHNPSGTFISTQNGLNDWSSFVTSEESYNAVTLTFKLSSNTNVDIGIGSSSVFHDDSRIAYFKSWNATRVFTVIKPGGEVGHRECSTETTFKLVYDGATIKMSAGNAPINEGTHSGPVHLYVRIGNKDGGVTNLVFEPPSYLAATPAPIPGATTAYGLTGSANTINRIDAITFQKTKMTDAWDSPLYSSSSIPGNKSCYLTFKPGQTTRQFIIGLNVSAPNESPTDDKHSISIDRGFHIYQNSTFDIRESGNGIVTSPSITYNSGDVFGIIYDTINYHYIRNGNLIKSTSARGSTGIANLPSQLYLDGSIFSANTLIQNIYFGILNNCPASS
jgi:hypothetical protein